MWVVVLVGVAVCGLLILLARRHERVPHHAGPATTLQSALRSAKGSGRGEGSSGSGGSDDGGAGTGSAPGGRRKSVTFKPNCTPPSELRGRRLAQDAILRRCRTEVWDRSSISSFAERRRAHEERERRDAAAKLESMLDDTRRAIDELLQTAHSRDRRRSDPCASPTSRSTIKKMKEKDGQKLGHREGNELAESSAQDSGHERRVNVISAQLVQSDTTADPQVEEVDEEEDVLVYLQKKLQKEQAEVEQIEEEVRRIEEENLRMEWEIGRESELSEEDDEGDDEEKNESGEEDDNADILTGKGLDSDYDEWNIEQMEDEVQTMEDEIELLEEEERFLAEENRKIERELEEEAAEAHNRHARTQVS